MDERKKRITFTFIIFVVILFLKDFVFFPWWADGWYQMESCLIDVDVR